MMSDWRGWLYVAAVLIPLAAFLVQVLFIRVLKNLNAYVATGAIAASFALSMVGFVSVLPDLLTHHEPESARGRGGRGRLMPRGTSSPPPRPSARPPDTAGSPSPARSAGSASAAASRSRPT